MLDAVLNDQSQMVERPIKKRIVARKENLKSCQKIVYGGEDILVNKYTEYFGNPDLSTCAML